ncbi:MAG: Chromosome segregation ATPase [Chloroflexi bacterium]|nr:MAG: Chromosome segregation ATPase [Chloroflexota bacterium]
MKILYLFDAIGLNYSITKLFNKYQFLEAVTMKLGLMALAALTAAIIFVGCGPAVGRATGGNAGSGDTATMAGETPGVTNDNLTVVNENLASQEALLVGQEKALGKHQAELENLKEIVTAFESNSTNKKSSADVTVGEIKAVAEEVSNMSDQLENDMAAQGQHLEEEISMMHFRITSLEEQSTFIQNLLGDIQDEAEAIRYSVSTIVDEIQKSDESVEQLIYSFDSIVSTTEDFQGQLTSLEDQAAFLNVAIEQSTSAIEQLDDALEEVSETQEELAESSNYPVTIEQFTSYANLSGDGLINDEINSLPAPEAMIVPDCTGPDGSRECIDKLVSSVIVGIDGTYESIQLSIENFCQAAESAYGLERVHGNRWDSTVQSDVTGTLLNAGFISETEFSIIQWSLKNRSILEDGYPSKGC